MEGVKDEGERVPSVSIKSARSSCQNYNKSSTSTYTVVEISQCDLKDDLLTTRDCIVFVGIFGLINSIKISNFMF